MPPSTSRVPASGGEPRQLTGDEASYAAPQFAPDGSALYARSNPRTKHVYNDDRLVRFDWADPSPRPVAFGFKRSVAACPTGTRIHAGGFDLGTAVGQANLTSSFLDVDVNSDPTRQGYEAQAREDGTGYTGIWRLATYAICAA